MLISRVTGAGRSPAAARESRPQAFELLIVYPPPRTPNFPATAGSASTAAIAEPPLRFLSRPQPHRIAAGLDSAYISAKRSICPAGIRAARAAASGVQGAARR